MTNAANDSYPLGRWQVRRMGYGAMQLAGTKAFGPPRDRQEALRVLRDAVDAGVDHIDTAHYYGPGVVNDLIHDALHPYPDHLAIVSKVAARRDEHGAILRYDEPRELRQGIEDNLRTLGIDCMAAVNLRISDDGDPSDRFDDQLAAMVQAREDGLIAGIGLSNIRPAHLWRALEAGVEVVCVQNAFSLAERGSQQLLLECKQRDIAFVPFCPLGWPKAQHDAILTNPAVVEISARLGHTPAQMALAWVLRSAANVLLIPGTSSRQHLTENLAVAEIELDEPTWEQLNRAFTDKT